MAELKKLSNITLHQGGRYYTSAPTVQFHGGFPNSSDHIKFGNNSLDASVNHFKHIVDSSQRSDNGFVAFWLWVDSGALPDSAGSNLKPLWEMGDRAGSTLYRARYGVDNLGRIRSTPKYTNGGSISTWENQGGLNDSDRIVEGRWNHVIFGFAGANQGLATRRGEVAINGTRVYYTNGSGFGGVTSDSGVIFGSVLQGPYGIGNVVFDSPSGMYIDNLYIDSGDAGFTLSTEIAALFTNDSNGGNWTRSSLDLFHPFNNDSAVATATVANNQVSSITITDSGVGTYITAPSIQFVGGTSNDSAFNIGDTVKQDIAGTVTGEVQTVILDSADDSSRSYLLAHVGKTDGTFGTFTTGSTLINSTLSASTGLTINSVTELNKVSETEQNDTFSTLSDDFLDFSENNPFGDPENQ